MFFNIFFYRKEALNNKQVSDCILLKNEMVMEKQMVGKDESVRDASNLTSGITAKDRSSARRCIR